MNARTRFPGLSELFLVTTALFILGSVSARAADIRLLATNPVSGSDYALLDLGNNPALSLAEMGQDFATVRQGSEAQRMSAELWTSDRGIYIGEGGGSYRSRMLEATWETLPSSRVIEISGVIEPGDTDRLRALVEETGFADCIEEGLCPYTNTISLNSPGGNLVEAIELGEYIAEQNFNTLIAAGATCESACALAFFGGYTDYEGYFFPRRYVHETATLGIHRPFFLLPERDFSSDEVGNIVEIVNEVVSRAASYLLNVGIGLDLLGRMYETPGDSMYYLAPLEMSANQIFVLGTRQTVTEMSRRDAFSYCSSIYLSEYSAPSPELLANLQMDDQAFITFVAGQNFVCAGVRQASQDVWRAHVCLDETCGLGNYGQVQFYAGDFQSQPEILADIAVALDVLPLGAALREFRHRSALLQFVRYYAESYDFLDFVEIAPAAVSEMPEAYCGEIDGFDPALVLIVQEVLNQNGIDVGRPDGAPGPNTRQGIRRFNQTRLSRDSDVIDENLLQAMGVSADAIQPYRLCP